MGTRGPIPNTEQDLARPRARKGKEHAAPISKGERMPVIWPEPPEEWHEIAKMIYLSIQQSGQKDFYQQSDVAMLYSVCEDVSHYKSAPRRNGQILGTIYSALGSLLVSEGDRRRLRIELHDAPPEESPAAVLAIASYKDKLNGGNDAPSS